MWLGFSKSHSHVLYCRYFLVADFEKIHNKSAMSKHTIIRVGSHAIILRVTRYTSRYLKITLPVTDGYLVPTLSQMYMTAATE